MKKVLLIAYDNYDDSETLYPLYRLLEAGAAVDIASLEKKMLSGKHFFRVEATLLPEEIDQSRYDALVLPGGTAPEKLRQNPHILNAVKAFLVADKPVAAICHGPLILISAGVLRGRKCTCYPGIRDDLINAGALYEDAPTVRDGNLVTSRRPEDLPYFMREFVAMLGQI